MSRRTPSRTARIEARIEVRARRREQATRMRVPDHVRALDPKKRQEEPRDRD